jgi:hypothetical protein
VAKAPCHAAEQASSNDLKGQIGGAHDAIVSGQTCGTDGRKASDKCGRLMRESWETDEWARPKGKFKI